jgi:hypothetical protein
VDDNGINAPYLYGKCLFTQPTDESVALANELVAAGRGPHAQLNLPIQSAASQSYIDAYFAQMSNGENQNPFLVAPDFWLQGPKTKPLPSHSLPLVQPPTAGTGLEFRESNADEPVHVYGPTECAEVDSQVRVFQIVDSWRPGWDWQHGKT